MRTRTRYFAIVSLLVLTIGLGTGLVAYYVGFQPGSLGRRGPVELKFVPVNASLVAYADVHDLMTSDVRQRIRAVLPTKEDGQREFQNQTGINIETDIDRVVAFVTPSAAASSNGRGSVMVLARGRFDNVKIEALMREHGAHIEEYKNERLIVADVAQGRPELSLVFVEPGLIGIGTVELVREAVDLKQGGPNVTSNDEMMRRIQDIDFGNAWAAGRFDVLTSQAKLPTGFAQQLPPLTWVAAGVRVGGGVSGVARAEAKDEESANSLREVARGFMALAKLQTRSNPQFEPLLRSLELGGSGNTVAFSFDLPLEIFDALRTLGASHPPDAR